MVADSAAAGAGDNLVSASIGFGAEATSYRASTVSKNRPRLGPFNDGGRVDWKVGSTSGEQFPDGTTSQSFARSEPASSSLLTPCTGQYHKLRIAVSALEKEDLTRRGKLGSLPSRRSAQVDRALARSGFNGHHTMEYGSSPETAHCLEHPARSDRLVRDPVTHGADRIYAIR